jgi:bacillithiol biosynthesis deacetylase BshB1
MSAPPTAERFDVLAFGAHPDDLEMSIAGTIARLTKAGRSVLMVSLTRGEASTHGDPETREKEAAEAARILGARHLLLDFPDTRVENTYEARLVLVRLVRRHRPSVVLAPYHTNPGTHRDGRANSDHMAAGAIARDALKLARFRRVLPEMEPHDVRRIFYYIPPAGQLPRFVVDVSDEEETLTRAIQAYDTQMAIRRQENPIFDLLIVMRRSYGVLIGKRLGEGFTTDEALEAAPEDLFRL